MKKISIFVVLILILGFTVSANAYDLYSVQIGNVHKYFVKFKDGRKESISSNRFKAMAIMIDYFHKHKSHVATGRSNCINGYCTYTMGSFVVVGKPISGDSFIITQSLFSTQLQKQLVFMLKRNGFSNASQINLTTAFVSYITPPGEEVFSTIEGLTVMVSAGNLKDFNEMVNLFIKHFININK